RRDTAESHHLLGQLVTGRADAVADLPAVDDDEDDRAVPALADGRPRRPWREHDRLEALEGAEDGVAVADEQRPAADRRDVVVPAGAEDVPDQDARPRRGLGLELERGAAGGREHGAAGRDRRIAALREL